MNYEVGDPVLYGREEDLVKIGYAEWLPVELVNSTPISPADAYKGLKKDELKALAESRKIDLGDATTNAEIIAKLVEADAANEGGGES